MDSSPFLFPKPPVDPVLDDPYPKHHVKAMPMIDITSISIQPQFDIGDTNPVCELFGHVKLINNYGKEYCLFERELNDPETISLLGVDQKAATLEKYILDHPLHLPLSFSVKVKLEDKLRKVEPIDVDRLLDFHSLVYDQELKFTVTTKSWIVTVNYRLFQCAIAAEVGITVFTKIENSNTGDDAAVTGTISASTKMTGLKEVSCLLFDASSKPAYFLIDDNKPTMLASMAVPAYSVLKIEPDIKVDGQQIFCEGGLEFEPEDVNPMLSYKVNIDGGEWVVQVSVFWRNGFSYLEEDEYCEFTYKIGAEGEFLSEDDENPQKKMKMMPETMILSDQSPSSHPHVSIQRILIFPSLHPRELVELFSISVGSLSCTDGGLRIHGTIKCCDSSFEDLVFDVSEKEPVMVYPHEPLTLELPRRCWKGDPFHVKIDLKDAKGGEISRGYLAWCRRASYKVYEKRTCSVISGKLGFAAVHYTIFRNAVSAEPKATLLVNGILQSCAVRGKIHARYSCYDYSNPYVKKHYQSVLFMNDKLVALLKGDKFSDGVGFDLPLSKHVLAVPSDASLIVEVNLQVWIGDSYKKIVGAATLYPDKDFYLGSTIRGDNCSLTVGVRLS